ncbi:tetratricopeptide repeat protein [Geothermobacter ehrlichii]|uniref:Tetratricopeptide repeat protein n=1 Tax=Geothermobacter ehrlichii TaxID=213224 RepID=A0A5D3WNS0_9BACT|nr:tetratricopeptide repeat protein [Geothermobacter ehrlichii]TYO99299.1 tetratricopeptide repeat protein [Geothermobacter ehrlichii]
MTTDRFRMLLRQGLDALDKNDTLLALVLFEDACKLFETPTAKSCLAYCLAREKKQFQKAVAMCLSAKQKEPANSLHYLNLGRTYLEAGQKQKAIRALRQGLKMERNQQIIDLLVALGQRKTPPISSLPREHFLNRNLGLLLSRIGMR